MVGPPLTTAPHWATVSSASPQRPLQLQSEAGKTRLKATEEGSVALQAAKIISHQGYNILLSRWEHQQPKFFCIGSRKSSVRGIQNTTTAHQKCIVSSLAEMILPRSIIYCPVIIDLQLPHFLHSRLMKWFASLEDYSPWRSVWGSASGTLGWPTPEQVRTELMETVT